MVSHADKDRMIMIRNAAQLIIDYTDDRQIHQWATYIWATIRGKQYAAGIDYEDDAEAASS